MLKQVCLDKKTLHPQIVFNQLITGQLPYGERVRRMAGDVFASCEERPFDPLQEEDHWDPKTRMYNYSQQALEFRSSLLCLDVAKRGTAEKMLKHLYITQIEPRIVQLRNGTNVHEIPPVNGRPIMTAAQTEEIVKNLTVLTNPPVQEDNHAGAQNPIDANDNSGFGRVVVRRARPGDAPYARPPGPNAMVQGRRDGSVPHITQNGVLAGNNQLANGIAGAHPLPKEDEEEETLAEL